MNIILHNYFIKLFFRRTHKVAAPFRELKFEFGFAIKKFKEYYYVFVYFSSHNTLSLNFIPFLPISIKCSFREFFRVDTIIISGKSTLNIVTSYNKI